MKKKCEEQEKLAIKLNEVALTRSDRMVTKDDIKRIKTGKSLTQTLIKTSFVCSSFEDAQHIASSKWHRSLETINRQVRPDGSPIAPMTLREKFFDAATKTFNNPTEAYLLNRMWGLNEDEEGCRAYPIQGGQWCVYGYLKIAPITPIMSIDEILGAASAPAVHRKRPTVASSMSA